MNDTTIIKAELCDFLSARTKNLANIQNMEDREVYIRMVVDASNQIENLTSLFSQFEKVDEILGFNHTVAFNNSFVGETNESVNVVDNSSTDTPDNNSPAEVQTNSEESVPSVAEKGAVEEESVAMPLKKEESISTGEKVDTVSEAKDEVKTETPVVEEKTKPEFTVNSGSNDSTDTASATTDKMGDVKLPPADLVTQKTAWFMAQRIR